MKNIILSLNPPKAIGLKSNQTKVLKLLINDNLPFSMVCFHWYLKLVKSHLCIPKKSKVQRSNHRQISLRSSIGKILERLLYNHLYNFLEMSSVKHDLQFSFWQKFSTSHALIHLIEKVRKQLDSGSFACGVLVDIQKVFGTIHHIIFIKKLNY